ncbi:uncharacterized protein LOC116200611 [Punica granatum]|uniref:Uncharacterized protein LOC116200611 n=1 Tax=Punica granatum TaxID=22663 RepID=A0A6P8D7K3_PUNGR|nr:uncharacterized protein LOC116200611 [Punica granatum]
MTTDKASGSGHWLSPIDRSFNRFDANAQAASFILKFDNEADDNRSLPLPNGSFNDLSQTFCPTSSSLSHSVSQGFWLTWLPRGKIPLIVQTEVPGRNRSNPLLRDGEVEVDTEALEEDVTADEKLNSHCEMTYVEMSRRLKSLKHDDKKFREVFVLFVMTALLAPNDNDKPKRTWLRVIEDISLIPRMNWAKFAFDRIICSVMGVKEGKSKAFKGLATVLSLLVCEYSTWIEGVEFRTKDLPLISRWDDQMMLKMHKIIVDKFGGYHTDNLMAKLKSEMLKVPVIEVVSARDDSWMLKMEACINQQEAAIEALRAENKRILDALDSIKKELHTVGEKVGSV